MCGGAGGGRRFSSKDKFTLCKGGGWGGEVSEGREGRLDVIIVTGHIAWSCSVLTAEEREGRLGVRVVLGLGAL